MITEIEINEIINDYADTIYDGFDYQRVITEDKFEYLAKNIKEKISEEDD